MGNNQSTGEKIMTTVGVVGGVVATVATLGAAAPLVLGAAEGAYVYHEYTTNNGGGSGGGAGVPPIGFQLETERVLLGLGAAAAVSSANSSSKNSGSTSTPTTCFEQRTIYDWWGNGPITCFERQELLNCGYSDRTGCFSLEQLQDLLDKICFEKKPGKPTEKDGFEQEKNWNGKLKKAPNSKRRGYPDKDGNVWVPSGEGTGVHEPHWDVEKPKGGYDNVYPGGRVRPGK